MVDTLYTVGSGSAYESKIYSASLYTDTIMSEPLIQTLIGDGVIRRADDLSRNRGGLVQMPFKLRLSGAGLIGDESDPETAATQAQYDYETLYIDQLTKVESAKIEGSISYQRTAFDLDEGIQTHVTDWYKQRFIASSLFSLGGYNATSISFDGTTYTGNQRKELWGMNTPTAPSTNRKVFATGSDDQTVNGSSSATLTLQLFDNARKLAMTQTAGVMNFRPITGKPYDYVALVSVSGMNQLYQQAQSNGNLTLSQIILNMYAAGTDNAANLPSFIYRRIKFIEVPDHYIPNGAHSGTQASQANVKRALFLGADALTLCLGQGYSEGGKSIPGFKVISETKPLKQMVLTGVYAIFGMKKRVVNSEDLSVITISHYVS